MPWEGTVGRIHEASTYLRSLLFNENLVVSLALGSSLTHSSLQSLESDFLYATHFFEKWCTVCVFVFHILLSNIIVTKQVCVYRVIEK